LQMQAARPYTGIAGHALGGMQQGLAFAHGNALLQGGKRQQIVKTPYTAETVRIVAPRPLLLERRRRTGNG